ncbi:MAG: gamma-glutamyltransferase family protein, partial [Bythopirellula sp.]
TAAQQRIAAENYAVVSGHPEATSVGLQVLRDGGNVVDAAIATSFALGVAEPYGSGLGGKLIMLYRDAATGEVHSIVALCKSPAALPEQEFVTLSSKVRKYSYRAVGVPGLVAGLSDAHARWGSKAWSELVEPAAQLADRGVTIDETMRGMFQPKVEYLRQNEVAASLYLVDGEAPEVGTVMKNADLAGSLREIAAGGAAAFYEGSIAKQIVADSQANGGWLSLDDFRNYQAEYGEPLAIDYRGCRIYSCPPPLTGGVTVLAALKCFECMQPQPSPLGYLRFTDDICRSLQCLYPTIRDTIADVATASSAAQELIGPDNAATLARRAHHLNPRDPQQDPQRRPRIETTSEGLPAASTSHLLVVDRAGNMVSLTQSLSLHFGASVIAPGTGILLNDSMSNFATHHPEAVNYSGAGKRARSTIAPIIATKAGKPWLALGIPGGQRIPTTTLQLLWRLIDDEATLYDAFAASRFHLLRPLRFDAAENVIQHEADASAYWAQQLRSRGWKLQSRARDGHYFGGGGAAQYAADGTIVGVADPRRTNFAAGD